MNFFTTIPPLVWVIMLSVLLVGLYLHRKSPQQILGGIWFWFGLNGDSGRPSSTKFKMFFAMAVTAIAILVFGLRLIETGKELNYPFVALVLILGAESFGLAGWKLLLESRVDIIKAKNGFADPCPPGLDPEPPTPNIYHDDERGEFTDREHVPLSAPVADAISIDHFVGVDDGQR